MMRTVKHFSLHRIAGTELRVVADVEAGVLPVIQVEEAVIRGYAQQEQWPHRWVTLFVLQDLQPLVRQLTPTPSLPLLGGGRKGGGADLPPGGAAALDHRSVVNIYDLADPAGCHVFVNRRAMAKEGYWDDVQAIRGLLAHEHAHPLAENETTHASRRLQVKLSLERPTTDDRRPPGSVSAVGGRPSAVAKPAADSQQWLGNRQDKIHRLLEVLAEKLCLYAPREVFANDMAIRSGFSESLLYLDRCNVLNASHSVAGREELRRQLQQEVSRGNLTPAAADVLLLIGDMKGYLDLALEVAPFYRTGHEAEAQGLETVLETEVFPHLKPEVPRAYTALREQYIALNADLTPEELVSWGTEVLNILAEALAEKGLIVQCRLRVAAGRGEEK